MAAAELLGIYSGTCVGNFGYRSLDLISLSVFVSVLWRLSKLRMTDRLTNSVQIGMAGRKDMFIFGSYCRTAVE